MEKVYLDICQGIDGNKAIYESDGEGNGVRLEGPKCWGVMKTLKKVDITHMSQKEIDAALEGLMKELE